MADLLGPPAALAVQPSEASIMTHAARSSTDGNEALAPPPPAAVPAGLASRHPFVAEPSSETLALMTPGATSPIIPPASEAAAGDADLSGDANGDADPVPGELPVVAPTIVNLDKQTVAGASKFMYLEGLRGIAAFFVANGHFVDSTFRQTHPEVANFKPFNLLWGGGWSVTLFFVLSGRVITFSFLRSLKKNPKFAALASAIFRRPFRLGIPCAAAIFIQWQLAINGATLPANDAGKIMNSPDMKSPGWSLLTNFADYVIFVFNLFTYGDPDYTLVRGSTVWTIPFEYWGSNFIYLMSFVMFLLPKRHWILYPVIIAMNWWTYNYNFMFFLGLLLADLEINGIWGRVRAWPWYVVLPLEIGLLAIAGVFLWVPQVALNVDYGVLPVQLYHGTLGAQASWHGISTSLWVSATLVLVWAEICSWGQIALEFWPFAFLGKISFGLYLMHPSVLFTIVPRLILTFNAMGMSYWPMVAACYCIYIPICFLLGWLFHLFVDEPGIFIGKWLWDRTVAESWPTSWAEVKAGVVSTVKGIFSFYKRAAWTAITCGCADSKKRQKQRAKKEKTVELNTAPEALEPLVKGKEIAEVATPELAVIKEPSPGGVEWHEMTKKLD